MQRKIVLYTDASSKPNPGHGGYGIFGYIARVYTPEEASVTKKLRHTRHINGMYFNSDGFSLEKGVDLTMVDYMVENITTRYGVTTNNTVELQAVIRCLDIVIDSCLNLQEDNLGKITDVHIYTDSNYVATAVECIPKWIENGFKRQDNKDLTHKEDWVRFSDKLYTLVTNNVNVKVEWIRGHIGNYGNEIADFYASVGSNVSCKNKHIDKDTPVTDIFSLISTYSDYTNSYDTRDFTLQFRDMFYGPRLSNTSYYFLCSLDPKPFNMGKNLVESIFALNVGYVPKFIDNVKNFINTKLDFSGFYCVKLNKLKDKDKIRLMNYIDVENLLYQDGRNYTVCKDDAPFIEVVNNTYPLILNVDNMFTDIACVYEYINLYKHTTVDVTDILMKNGKFSISNNETYIDLTDKVDLTSMSIRLLSRLIVKVGNDLPSYLAMKNIEESILKIEMILDVNKDNKVVTCYFMIACTNRTILTCNIKNKYFIA